MIARTMAVTIGMVVMMAAVGVMGHGDTDRCSCDDRRQCSCIVTHE